MNLSPSTLPLFRELGDLKRIYSADRPGSIAQRLFAAGWSALCAGDDVHEVTYRITAAALAAARLGDLDRAKLRQLGLEDEGIAILQRAFDEIAPLLSPRLRDRLRATLEAGAPDIGTVLPFVDQLARQPRAGVTSPGQPRIMLQPAENHAEHSLVVAIYGVIAAGWEGADPAAVFLAGMAHHLHSAVMPDSGFSGEILLGDALEGVMDRAREMALAELAPDLAQQIRRAVAPIAKDETAEARAFHIGDVIDRVIEIEQHLVGARLTMEVVLDDYGLVHDGPVKAYHDRILAQVGLA